MKTIELTQGKVAMVDDCDYDYLTQFTWHCKDGYAWNPEIGYMHHVVLARVEAGQIVNQLPNLRGRNYANN